MSLNLYIVAGSVALGLLAAFFTPPVVGPLLFGAVIGAGAFFAGMWAKRYVE